MPTQLQESIGWELVCRATSTTSSSGRNHSHQRGRRSINSSSLSSSSCRATSSTSSSGRDHSHQRGRRSTNSSGVSSSSCRATSNTSSSGRNHSHQRIVIFGRRCAPDEHWKLKENTKKRMKMNMFISIEHWKLKKYKKLHENCNFWEAMCAGWALEIKEIYKKLHENESFWYLMSIGN